MPSGRQQIMDRVLVILPAITIANGYNTDVAYVTETAHQYNELKPKEIPALVPVDLDEERDMVAFPTGSSYGQRGILTLRISAVVYDRQNDTRTKRLNLMLDVEKALLNDATLAALGVDIEPTRIITDDGTIQYYSMWDQFFSITYYYNRTDGG